jgi:Xaa-Pro dipeptidase
MLDLDNVHRTSLPQTLGLTSSRSVVHAEPMTPTAPALPKPDLARMRGQRLDRLQAQMREQHIEAAVLLHGPNVTYATGFVPDAIDASHLIYQRPVAIVPVEGPARLHAHGDARGLDARIGEPLWPELDDDMATFRHVIQDAIGDTEGRRIAVDSLTGAMARADVLSGAELVDASRVLGPARLCKTVDEVACIEHAQILNEQAMTHARARCVPGATRSMVAGAFLRALRDLGGEHNEIDPIFQVMPRHLDGGPRTSTGHVAFPTGIDDPVFAEGDLVWVDAGHGYEGYASDFGRTWIVGRDPSREEQSCFDRWATIMDACFAAVRPGASLGDIGRAATTANGDVSPWLPHFYLAHAVGLDSAEMPMIGSDLGPEFDDGYVLAAGMILVLEPVVWDDGVASYRAEEIIVVTDDGHRVLTGGAGYAPFTRSEVPS